MQLFNNFQLRINHQLLELVHIMVVVVGGVGVEEREEDDWGDV